MLIGIPKWSHLPFNLALAGGVGYAVGLIGNLNTKLSAGIPAIYTLADHIFFQLSRLVLNRFNYRLSVIRLYNITNTLISAATIVAMRQFDLISLRTAGALGFVTGAILIARLTIIYSNGQTV
ncbi:hypothetical protein [Candidatus Protochlamydia phocaeensis]|uniref:hypothetical protein n=1 Tax=Candidatus Protochlamydia phocaeensis TaxID=1414722 RepID=UPI00083929C2|nr:hypothetical protein [Candidatus Protochlamydia phocaeensis]